LNLRLHLEPTPQYEHLVNPKKEKREQIQATTGPKWAFGTVLRDLRQRRGISQEQLAAAAGLDRSFISLVEGASKAPISLILLKIAEVLKVSEEISSLKCSLDQKMYRADARKINRTFYRLRMIVLIALTTGMRIAEIFGLTWNDLRYCECTLFVHRWGDREGRSAALALGLSCVKVARRLIAMFDNEFLNRTQAYPNMAAGTSEF